VQWATPEEKAKQLSIGGSLIGPHKAFIMALTSIASLSAQLLPESNRTELMVHS